MKQGGIGRTVRGKAGLSLRSKLLQSMVVVAGLVFGAGLVAAPALGVSLSQGYNSKDNLTPGTLVSSDSSSPNSVKISTSDHPEDLFGVVVAADSSILALSGGKGEVQVATSGLTSALVSNISGDIKLGDKITISPIGGVGSRATTSTKVVGVAQADFNAKSTGATSRDIKDRAGQSKTVAIGQIPVLVSVQYFVVGSGDQNTLLPRYVQDLVNAIAGKKVSILRIGLAFGLMLFALVAVGVIIFGSVHSSIISIGRNPLSQSAVYRSLLFVIAVSTGILLVTLGAVYLIISR